jgi:hypothetical protein
MVGSRVSVWLNQKLVVDHVVLDNYYDKNDQKLAPAQRRPVPARGPVQLQTHGGATHWRNIFLREIGADEANRLLASRGAEGFTRIFNGRDLEGWAIEEKGDIKTPGDVMQVRDGTLVWRANKGGTPYWHQELADFQARAMFKIPPGGNNGFAIRYPGKGNTAYDGMTELQIIDENYYAARKQPEKQLDPRQYHGSVYGMVAAVRGYLRPSAEWNFQEITVRGSTIVVELNGTVILDTDLANVKEFMANKPHPGKDRPSGHFGFAGHSDPVAFRNVSIRRL